MNKRGEFIDFLMWAMVVFLVLFVIGGLVFGIFIAILGGSTGTHTGYVTAVEHNNNLLWDADLVYFKTDTQSTQEDVYCINNPVVKSLLEQYGKEGKRITIHFHNDFFTARSECNGGISIITSAEEYLK